MVQQTKQNQGVTLIITFFVVVIMLSMALALAAVVIRQFKISNNNDDSLSAFYAANTGIEKTLYYDRKQIPSGAARGLCSICTTCPDCSNCTLTPGASGGCNASTCTNCTVQYNSSYNPGRTFFINANVSGSQLIINAQGFYNNASRSDTYNSNQ